MVPPPPHPATPAGLFGLLPPELLLAIFAHLTFPSALALATTSRLFQRVVQPTRHIAPSAAAAFLRYAEIYLARDPAAVGACLKCRRVVPAERLRRGAQVPAAWRVRRKMKLGLGRAGDGGVAPVCTDCEGDGDGELTRDELAAYRLGMDDIWDAPIQRCGECAALRFPPCHMVCEACGDCACLAAECADGRPEYFVEEDGAWCHRCGEVRWFKGRPRMDRLVQIGWEEFEDIWERVRA